VGLTGVGVGLTGVGGFGVLSVSESLSFFSFSICFFNSLILFCCFLRFYLFFLFLLPKCVLQSLDLLVFLTIGIWARAVVFWTRLAPIRIFDLPFAVFSHPFGLVFGLLCLVLSSSVAIASLAF